MVGHLEIPRQLDGLRFNRVRFKEKRAFEFGWQKNPYTYSQIKNYFPKENYGVICGSDVRVLDDDTPDKLLINLFLLNFGDTFRVRDHLYFRFDNGFKDKIIFYHPTKIFKDSNGNDTDHMGELQGEGTYVVGPNSTHPSGELYEIKNDIEIKTIDYNEFKKVFSEYMTRTKAKNTVKNHKPTNWSGDNISDIPIGNIISFNGLHSQGSGCFQGPHPGHGSDGGTNFRVDTNKNTWYCFRCCSGGGPSELIGVMEGIISCRDAGQSCYTKEQAQEVIKIAREKYGLSYKQETLSPQSIAAQYVSIIELAKKNNFMNCPSCGNPFKFKEYNGFYYCETCKYGGGLYKFSDLIKLWRDKNDMQ